MGGTLSPFPDTRGHDFCIEAMHLSNKARPHHCYVTATSACEA